MEIVSKRHPYNFYLTLILCNAFLLTLVVLLFIKCIEQNNNKYGLGCLFILAISISVTIGFIKNASTIILDTKGIIFRKKFYSWDDLSSTKLTGRGDMVFTSGECATLIFKNNKKIEIFDDFYSNSAEIKYFIQENIIDSKEINIAKHENDFSDVEKESFTTYKGNPVFSFNGIIMWGLILYFALMLIRSNKSINIKATLFFVIISVFWISIISCSMYYFEISKKFFVVKNHYFFWKKDIYFISNIREIVYERQHKQSNKIRLILNDYNTKTYLAGSLTDKTWLEMKDELENKNITIRNHSIPVK